MSKVARPLAEAQAVARRVIDDLSPFCRAIEVAGSVRRGKPEVGDLEIVAQPRHVQSGGLFGTEDTNALWRYLQEAGHYTWLKGNNEQGRYYQLRTADDWQVDLFLADEQNYGLILLIRTGSATFSQSILARWKRLMGIPAEQQGSKDGRLVYRDGTVLPTPTEQDVFNAVKLPWMEPALRTEGVR